MNSDQLAGTWKLVSFEFRAADGRVFKPFGDEPKGVIIGDKLGNVAAQVMASGRKNFASQDVGKATPEEALAAMSSYVAYFGRASVDEKGGKITTRVIGSLIPNWTGGDQVRLFKFSGDRLILSTPPMPLYGATATGVLEWEKIG